MNDLDELSLHHQVFLLQFARLESSRPRSYEEAHYRKEFDEQGGRARARRERGLG